MDGNGGHQSNIQLNVQIANHDLGIKRRNVGKSKHMVTKQYILRVTGHDDLHKFLYDYLKRFLFIEGRKIENSEIEVHNIV